MCREGWGESVCTHYVAQGEQPLTSSLQTLTIPFAIFVSACLATETQEIQSRSPSLSPFPLTTIVDDTVVQYPLCVVQELPRGLVPVSLHFLHRKRQHSAQGVGRKKTRRREEKVHKVQESAASPPLSCPDTWGRRCTPCSASGCQLAQASGKSQSAQGEKTGRRGRR